MNVRQLRFFLAIGAVVICLVLHGEGCAADRLNVLFIAVDDLNDWVGCLNGHPQSVTPNIDALAARGVLFSNAHCAAPACNPSRAAVFSGRMPMTTNVWSNNSRSLGELYPQGKTLPQAFRDADYRVLGTGKLLHRGAQDSFDEYFAVQQRWSPLSKDSVKYTKAELPSKGTKDPRHVAVDHHGKTVVLPLNRMPSDRKPSKTDGESFDWGPFDVPDRDFGDTQITDWAIDRLSGDHDIPFFLAVGYYRPHIPLWAPHRFFKRFSDTPGMLPPFRKDDLADVGEAARRWAREPVTAGSHATVVRFEQWRQAVEAYLACVTYVDYEIGRLMRAFDASPHRKNTVIVLWSDHGWHLGEKEHWGKWTGWERATKVPLVIVPSGNRQQEYAPPGTVCEKPVGLIDLYPTLGELCGVDHGQRLDGRSLVGLLKNPALPNERFVLTTFDRGNYSLRSEQWRYIRYADGSQELYDHSRDPNEWQNLADSPDDQPQLHMMSNQLEKRLSRLTTP